jgi:hypothetical protein
VPPTLREFDLSGTKPILPRRRKRELVSPQRRPSPSREEFGPRLPSHSIRPGLFSKLCGTLARRRQLGSASSSDKLYTLRCATPYYRTAGADTPHPCQPRTSNPSAAAKFPRRARTLTIFPCSAPPERLGRLKKFQGASRRRSLTFCNNFAVCSFSAKT